MDKKVLLQELCDNLEQKLCSVNGGKITKVEFFNGLVPTDHPKYSLWLVEIKVGGVVVFKDGYKFLKSLGTTHIEDLCLSRVFQMIFDSGIMHNAGVKQQNG